jgi:uncharacterized membrane protein
MDSVMVLLRVGHILAGVFWAGAAFMMAGFVTPTVRALGADGGKFVQALVQRSRFSQAMGLAALVTVVCGLILFWRVSGGLQTGWLTSGRGLSLTIGSLAGLVAYGHGFAVQGKKSAELGALAKEIAAGGKPPTAQQAQCMGAIQTAIARGGLISAGLLAICVVGMSAARYL